MSAGTAKTASPDGNPLRRIGVYFRPHRLTLALVVLGMLLVGGAESMLAVAAKVLMDLFSGITQTAGSPEGINVHLAPELGGRVFLLRDIAGVEAAVDLIWTLAIVTLGLVLFKGLVHFAKEYLMWGVTNRVLMRIKHELFAGIVALPLSYFDREKSGDILSRVTYDVTRLEESIRALFILVKSLVYAVIFLTAMFLMDWTLTMLVIGIFPLSALVIKVFGDRIRRVSRAISQNVADYTAYLGEMIGGVKVIKAFGREKDMGAAFERKIRDNFRYSMKVAKYGTLHAPAQEIISAVGMAGLVVFSGYRLLGGDLTIGDMTGFLVLLTYAYKPIKTLGETNVTLQRALASASRVFQLLDQPNEQQLLSSVGRTHVSATAADSSGGVKPSEVKGDITFKGVTFRYPRPSATRDSSAVNREGLAENHPVLLDINLEIRAGETLALVGPSGAGKSTLVSLIPRFYPIPEGRVLIDGRDISECDLEWLRRQMALVPQETVLFSGSVEENIRLGMPDATFEQLQEAARAANAHGFITGLPDGYGAEVGERGVQLSGGQRQRIAIARAVLRNPRILLLDEATSALDSESERLIKEALDRFRSGRTTIIIAHRLSTVQSADRIAVLDAGRLVELGTHHELFRAGGLYRQICDGQLYQGE